MATWTEREIDENKMRWRKNSGGSVEVETWSGTLGEWAPLGPAASAQYWVFVIQPTNPSQLGP